MRFVEGAVRQFSYNGMVLPDPGETMSVDEVKDFYANQYPELSSAGVTAPSEVDGVTQYGFVRKVGTKG